MLSATQKTILGVLEQEECDRSTLVEKTGIPRTTLYENINKMELAGKIDIFTVNGSRGRPSTRYKLSNQELSRRAKAKARIYTGLSIRQLEFLDKLVNLGYFPSRSDVIRHAITTLFELRFYKELFQFEKENNRIT